MFSLKVDISGIAKKFDRMAKAAERANKNNLMRIAAYTWKIVVNSLKSVPKHQKETSKPGSPPYSRLGRMKGLMRFEWDDSRKCSVVGPMSTGGSSRAPGVLEHGGVAVLKSHDKKGNLKVFAVHIEPRPFLAPALKKAMPKVKQIWKESVPSIR